MEADAAELGLQLNHGKSELICDLEIQSWKVRAYLLSRDSMLLEFSCLCPINCSQATLLGIPIGSVECVSDTIKVKSRLLELMGDRLSLLPSHDALLLLRHSFAIPKVLYLLRTAPCFLSSELGGFDDVLRHLLSNIVNIPLSNESAWLQASLPVRAGGIGIRRTVQLAPSAYLASAAGCSELIQQILPPRLRTAVDPLVEVACNLWQQAHQHPPPALPSSRSQRAWDSIIVEVTKNTLLDAAHDQ